MCLRVNYVCLLSESTKPSFLKKTKTLLPEVLRLQESLVFENGQQFHNGSFELWLVHVLLLALHHFGLCHRTPLGHFLVILVERDQ